MGGKQLTYAHRRTKKRPLSPPNSSPLEELTDPELYISKEQMEKRMKKRSRGSNAGSGSKSESISTTMASKDLPNKPQGPTVAQPEAAQPAMEKDQPEPYTPFQEKTTLLASGLLPRSGKSNSTGVSLGPKDMLSPTKVVQPKKISRSTSSSKLKENSQPALTRKRSSRSSLRGAEKLRAVPRKSAAYTALASPFTSRPSSPHHPPGSAVATSRHALSDTHFNPNIPAAHQGRNIAQSATNSPTHIPVDVESVRNRRPSAPSATGTRPDPSLWEVTQVTDARDGLSSDFSFFDLSGNFPRGPQIDFNRTPSQLSFTSSYDERFFDDIQGISTPIRDRNLLNSLTDEEFVAGLDKYSDATWITDSLISPPTLKRAYSWPSARNAEELPDTNNDQDSLGLGTLKLGSKIASAKETIEDASVPAPGVIEDLLASLDLGNDNEARTLTSPSHFVEFQTSEKTDAPLLASPARLSSIEPVIEKKPRGRHRRDTIRASDFSRPETEPIRPPAGTRTRSGTIVQAPGLSRKRNRSDTVVARPRVSVPQTPPSGSSSSNNEERGLPGLDSNEKTACNSGVDADVDELNLKGKGFNEAWVVASPPSPVVPRRKKRKGIKNWRADHVLGKGIGTWGMKEHNEDDGADDPLLLH